MTGVAFVWDNFGPMHDDRCAAVQAALGTQYRVIGIEQFASSDTYDWDAQSAEGFYKIILHPGTGRSAGVLSKARAILRALRKAGARHVFFCNYERPEILMAALALRLTGGRCYVMGCSKFDDYARVLWRERFKRLFYLPYRGGISSGIRARDYMRFLGLPEDRVTVEYNTLSLARIRAAAGVPPAPGGTAFGARHFTVVARFVPKKNLAMALRAYALYAAQDPAPRALHLCGSGPLEGELRALADSLGIGGQVVFRGFLQSDVIAGVLGQTLCLLLPSVEEQFGNVVIEAQAMGVPVILSDNCGARDRLVRSGRNGFVVEPDNPEGMAWFMTRLAGDAALWAEFAQASADSAPQGDVARFAEAVARLIGVSVQTRVQG
ncbi:glycosyltransferase [Puniceibacterium sp. IMCC21224]|uniref:glycosyltransferase n=1 Tax=Puniceibacterium sp. IMCC21224 TaxID=1618204 RepID=UPI00064DA17D|nr:glycosyltransferase [Puniceibacterium sp. IMCC21224]KMK63830.1 glycosyl transferase group 1 [Puniceibacterium sp. IMCC21224]